MCIWLQSVKFVYVNIPVPYRIVHYQTSHVLYIYTIACSFRYLFIFCNLLIMTLPDPFRVQLINLYFYQMLTTLNKLKIMTEVSCDNRKSLKLFTMPEKWAFTLCICVLGWAFMSCICVLGWAFMYMYMCVRVSFLAQFIQVFDWILELFWQWCIFYFSFC
jgi:hypothetical protein